MSNFLLENQKEKYRLKINDEIYLLEPTEEQRKTLVGIIEKNVKVSSNLEIQGTIPMDSVRFILKELTSIGGEIDKMTDEEISNAIENGNRNIVLIFRGVKQLIDELLEDLQYNMEQQIRMTASLIEIIKMEEAGAELQNKIKEFNEKYNKKLDKKDVKEIKENPELMAEKIKTK